MHTFVEMWQTGVTYFCVSALLATLLALAAGLLWRHCQSEIEGITAALRRMPLPVRVVAIIAIGNVIVYGSTKGPMGGGSGGSSDADYGSETMTGEDYGSETMSGEDYGSELMMLSAFSLEDADESVDTGFTAADLARGFVVTGIGTNEVWDFAMPTGASAIAQWRLRGACEDVAAIASNVVVISDGRIAIRDEGSGMGDETRPSVRVFAPLHTMLGIVPEANWGLLPSNATESLVWHGPTGGSTYGVCWRNVLPGRTADRAMSFAAEFGRDGAIVYKYGDLPDDVATNAVIGCWCAGNGQRIAGIPGLTSVRLHTVAEEDLTVRDKDGDGLSTYDEIFTYGTDPDVADTDGDGVNDGDEVAEGDDPLVRETSDAAILARVAGQAAEERDEGWGMRDEVEDELASLKLFDGFAAGGDGVRGATALPTNGVIYEATVAIDPHRGWTSYFLSARSGEAHGWWLEGLRLEWSDDDGNAGVVSASPSGDSVRLAVSPYASALTVRVVVEGSSTEATGTSLLRAIRSAQPLYLLEYTPKFEVSGGQVVPLGDGSVAYVFTDAEEAAQAVTLDRANRPCKAGLSVSEPTAYTLPEGYGSWSLNPWAWGEESLADTEGDPVSPPPGDRIVVIGPTMTYGTPHAVDSVVGYPFSGDGLGVNWWRDTAGMFRCGCAPEIGWGGVTDTNLTGVVTEDDGCWARGEIRYGGTVVWRGAAEHRIWGADDEETHWVCSCATNCPYCTCRQLDGVSSGSVRFRVSLGEVGEGLVAGFVWFESAGPVQVTPDLFQVTKRDDATVNAVTNGTGRTYAVAGTGGRAVAIEAITNGVEVVVLEAGGGHGVTALPTNSVWQITNEGTNAVIRFVKRDADGATISDETWSCAQGDGSGDWEWSSVDNLAATPVATGWEELDGSTNLVYDTAGRLVSMSAVSDDGTATNLLRTITYNAAGQMTLVDDGTNGTVALTYDAEGRLASVTGPEGTLRYTYDAGGNLIYIDTSDWNGDPLDDGGEPMLMLLNDDGDDPPLQHLSAEYGYNHYKGEVGTPGAPLAMPFGDMDTSAVKLTDFKEFRDFAAGCHGPGTNDVEGTLMFLTKHPLRLLLGEVELRLRGRFVVQEGCTWSFEGTLSCGNHPYDFNTAREFNLRNALTLMGSFVPGTDYTIYIRGTKSVTAHGGCGGHQ